MILQKVWKQFEEYTKREVDRHNIAHELKGMDGQTSGHK